MNTNIREEATALLKAFFAAMNRWQIACMKRSRMEKHGEISAEEKRSLSLSELHALLNRYCNFGEMPQEYHFASPPSFDADKEEVLEVTVKDAKIIEVVTKQHIAPFFGQYKYFISNTDKGLRILNRRQVLSVTKNKYQKHDLLL